MNENTGSNRGPEIRRRIFRSNRWTVPRFVVHLAVVTADLAGAANLACALARSLAFMPEIDGGETTVSEENNQGIRHRVFCDRLLPDRRRCALRHAHAERCRPAPPLPPPPAAVTSSDRR